MSSRLAPNASGATVRPRQQQLLRPVCGFRMNAMPARPQSAPVLSLIARRRRELVGQRFQLPAADRASSC